MEEKRKTVLITGASRGIGKAIAQLFAANGYHVAVNYHQSHKEAFALVEELSAHHQTAFAVHADVGDPQQVCDMVRQVEDQFGSIDVLINNAGIAQQKLFTDLTEADWNRMFDVNVKGIFHCCQAVLPQMITAKKGKIINIASIWGICGASCEVHYSAAKAAVIGFTKALAKEVGPSNIQVNCVAPGLIQTDMNAHLTRDELKEILSQIPLQRLGQPNEIAESCLFLASDRADYITGQVISLNGGWII